MKKLIGIEEHFVTPEILTAWRKAPSAGLDGLDSSFAAPPQLLEQLVDLSVRREQDMDDQGVDTQVLSVTSPGVQNLNPSAAIPLARHANDKIAKAVAANPVRFQGFATLPTADPRAAADELRRSVMELGLKGAMIHGRSGSTNIDDPSFAPIWQAAAELRCPISLHPQHPVASVREAYYSGFGAFADAILSGPMLGWHYETGVQLLRVVLAGTFDRFPGLQLVAGHWGELVLFYLDRISDMQNVAGFRLERPVAEYFKHNVYYTGSGQPSARYLRWAMEVVGVSRILYATDYPFIDLSGGRARAFLEQAEVSDEDRDCIAFKNWERLTAHLV